MVTKRILVPTRLRRPPATGWSWVDRRLVPRHAERLARWWDGSDEQAAGPVALAPASGAAARSVDMPDLGRARQHARSWFSQTHCGATLPA